MAGNTTFNARLKNKRDTSSNWTSANPVILNGEIILVDTAEGELRAKIGDGSKTYTQLPFSDEALRALIDNRATLDAGVYTVTASSSDGIAYTATVPGITVLEAGASFIMIPGKTSTSKTPTLNVNGLGEKNIRRRLSILPTSLQEGYSNAWLATGKPFTLVYDGTAWVVEGMTRPAGVDIYGTVPQAKADADGNIITDTYATIAMLQSMLPKVTTVTLSGVWNGSASPYYKDVTLSCVTESSLVTLQPTPEQLASWQDEGLAFTTLSGDGTVRIYCAGGLPSEDITVQVTVQEVVEV